ncbi:MAG: glutamate--tRNA ligase [Candidatus Dormibacteria bacterium]
MRTRFAPSPTGPLHFGSVRTALFAWLAARHSGGQFILRIEDTDQGRYIPDSEALILETLQWLGLEWDEGPEVGGAYGPYVQSLRTDIYRGYAEELVGRDGAYWCTCTPERLTAMREEQQRRHEPTRYDRRCASRQDDVARERESGMSAVLRLLMPAGTTEWHDIVRGVVSFDNANIDDQVLLKSDGFPTYHLAVVVDDHLMEITHVIRAEEWIPSTPKHLALYAAFEWAPPQYAHVPVVLGTDGLKLSKRRGAGNVLEYGELGYLSSAVDNAMALLGWSSGTGEEVFTLDELRQQFTLERIHPSPATFDPKRLDDLNGLHIRRLSVEELVEALEHFLPATSKDTRRQLAPMLQHRMVTLTDAELLAAPLLHDVVLDGSVPFPPDGVSPEVARAMVQGAIDIIERGTIADHDAVLEQLRAIAKEHGAKVGAAFRALYVAMLGSQSGVPVIEAMQFLGPEVSGARLRRALALLA